MCSPERQSSYLPAAAPIQIINIFASLLSTNLDLDSTFVEVATFIIPFIKSLAEFVSMTDK